MAGTAEADVVYTRPATPVVANSGFASFTINAHHVGMNAGEGVAGTRQGGRAYVVGSNLKFFQTSTPFFFVMKKFAPGAAIPGSFPFPAAYGLARLQSGQQGSPPNLNAGVFVAGNTGFAGFATSGGRLGWLRLEVLDRNSNGYADGIEAIDWAYNNTPGAAIAAGEGAVPEPELLPLVFLGAGATALLAWRRRRAASPR